MLRLVDDYQAPVAVAWRIQSKSSLRYGLEFETGWAAPEDRAAFFRSLELRNLDRYCSTKPALMENAGVVVMARPLIFLEAKRVAKRITEAVAGSAAVRLHGCGVYVSTTRGAWSPQALELARTWVTDNPALDGILGHYAGGFGVRLLGADAVFGPFDATRHVRIAASYVDFVDAVLRYAEGFVAGGSFDPAAFAAWLRERDGYQALKWRMKRRRV